MRLAKLVVTGVILVVTLTLFGASVSLYASENITLNVWRFSATEEGEQLISKWGEAYSKANPNVKVEFSYFPWATYIGTKLTMGLVTATGPDVFFISPGFVLDMVNNKVSLPVEDYISDAVKKDYYPNVLETYTFGGHLIGVPIDMGSLGLFYNRSMFEDAGLQPPKTWQEMIDAGLKLKTEDRWGIYIEMAPGAYQNYAWYPWLYQGGGKILNDDWTASEFDSEATVQALQLWGDLVNKYKIAPTQTAEMTSMTDEFINGATAMQETGEWAVEGITRKYPDFPLGIVPLPIPTGGKISGCFGGWTLMVNQNSQHPEDAAKFAVWTVATEDISRAVEYNLYVGAQHSTRRSVNEAMAGLVEWGNGFFELFSDVIDPASPAEPRFPKPLVDIVNDAIQNVLFREVSARDAAREASEKIDQYMKGYQGATPKGGLGLEKE